MYVCLCALVAATFVRIAQLVKRLPPKPVGSSSSPDCGILFFFLSQLFFSPTLFFFLSCIFTLRSSLYGFFSSRKDYKLLLRKEVYPHKNTFSSYPIKVTRF